MNRKQVRFLMMLATLLLALPGFAQQTKKKNKAASFDGTTGLFRTWDAETLKRGELNFTIGWSHWNRDPGQLRFQSLSEGGAIGIADRFEFFASFDALKRVRATNIRTGRPFVGGRPTPAQTPLGVTYFTNEAPFMNVARSSDIGDVRLGGKFAFFNERRGAPLSVSLVGFVKIPTSESRSRLNRGLTTGEVDAGYGYLFSKTAGNFGRLHLNTMVNFVKNPFFGDVQIADLQHEFQYRGGGEFPSHGNVQLILEVDGKTYWGSRSRGLNPRSPVDVIVGIRGYATPLISLGVGYRASVNHIKEDTGQQILPAGTHGWLAQLTVGRRANEAPTAVCVISTSTIKQGETTTIRVNASDPDGDDLFYTWSASGGRITGTGDTATFDATGLAPGRYTVTATVSDGKKEATCSTEVNVIKRNEPPTLTCEATASVTIPGSITVRATASDPNNDKLTYTWTINGQRVASDGPSITFGSEGRQPGTYTVTATVSDGELTATCSTRVTVAARANRPPTIECLTTSVNVESGGTVELRVRTADPDNDTTTVTWTTTGGTISGTGNTATFNATGLRGGTYTVTATVQDGRGGRASCTITVNVTERRTTTPAGFAPGSARVDNVAKAVLDDIAVQMQNDPRLQANITGYTDGSRREASMKNLGRRRAQAVANYLRKKGIDNSRLTVADGGDSKPIGDRATAAGRKQNRRVEIELSPR